MKKQSEKQPIDDLFARKLGNMSLPPRADGFERLQARMGQGKPQAQMVFWQNPVMQRYMAAAACLLLICLFGWLYWPSGTKITPGGQEVATNQADRSKMKNPVREQLKASTSQPLPEEVTPVDVNQQQNEGQLAKMEKSATRSNRTNQPSIQSAAVRKPTIQPEMSVNSEPVLAQTKPNNSQNQTKPEVIQTNIPSINQVAVEQVAENRAISKPAPAVERVLVVTIDEPAALVAARQAANKAPVDENPVVAVDEKTEKESKAGGLWQQVKRIKQGELFARHDNPANEDRGLLGRAYTGLKHSLDKDKSTKQ